MVFLGDSRTRQIRDGMAKLITGVDLDWLSNSSIHYNRIEYLRHENTSQSIGQSRLNLSYVFAGGLENKDSDLYLRELGKARARYGSVNKSLIHVAGFAVWTIWDCKERNISFAECLKLYER